MTHTTYYPSLDGQQGRNNVNEVWNTKMTSTGNMGNDTTNVEIQLRLSTSGDGAANWRTCRQGYFLFDTSNLAGDVVSAASFDFVTNSTADYWDDSIAIIATTPASNTALANGDWPESPFTRLTDSDKTVASYELVADDTTFTQHALNATGLTHVDTTGITKLGVFFTTVVGWEAAEPDGDAAGRAGVLQIHSADETAGGEIRPRLVVTHAVGFTPRAIMF
jgi:hypothetical protein